MKSMNRKINNFNDLNIIIKYANGNYLYQHDINFFITYEINASRYSVVGGPGMKLHFTKDM
jgi:hypothetical protein